MDIYTVKEVSGQLKVSPRTVERLIEQRHLRALHIGRRLRITQEALDAYLTWAGQDEPSPISSTPRV